MLIERIKNTLEIGKFGIDQRKLSKIAKTNESSLSRFLSGHEEMNFESILRIVQHLYPDQETEIMLNYIPFLKSKNARYALEYCAMVNAWDNLKSLIDFLSCSSNPVDKEWAAIYDLLRMRKEKVLSPKELLYKIEVFKPKEIEMQILRNIFKSYLYFDSKEYDSVCFHINGMDELIKTLKSQFIKDSFNVRLGLALITIYLADNNLTKAREYCHQIIEQDFFKSVKGPAYYNLGHSYLFTDHEQANKYLNKALNLFKSVNNFERVNQTELNLSFLDSYWKVEREFKHNIDNYNWQANYIFYLIQKGKYDSAKELIDKINPENLSEWDKGFYYYYSGLLTNDIDTYYISVECFINMNNCFFLNLPLEKLKDLGENEKVLYLLSQTRRKKIEKD